MEKEFPKDKQPEVKEQASKEEKSAEQAKKKAKDKVIKIKDSEYQKLASDAVQYKDKYIRLYAEFENVRKRMEREKLEFIKYANEEIVFEFLNVLDDLERSVAAAKEKHQDYDAFLKGIELVMAHIYEMLKKNGVKPVEAQGKKFDPNCHEALMQEEAENVDEGTVIQEFQKGYYLGERVVRTAKVKVSKNKETGEIKKGE